MKCLQTNREIFVSGILGMVGVVEKLAPFRSCCSENIIANIFCMTVQIFTYLCMKINYRFIIIVSYFDKSCFSSVPSYN